jgi:hypothetical protein
MELYDGVASDSADRFRVRAAREEQLGAVKVESKGYALRWDELDEDLAVPGVAAGRVELPLE